MQSLGPEMLVIAEAVGDLAEGGGKTGRLRRIEMVEHHALDIFGVERGHGLESTTTDGGQPGVLRPAIIGIGLDRHLAALDEGA